MPPLYLQSMKFWSLAPCQLDNDALEASGNFQIVFNNASGVWISWAGNNGPPQHLAACRCHLRLGNASKFSLRLVEPASSFLNDENNEDSRLACHFFLKLRHPRRSRIPPRRLGDSQTHCRRPNRTTGRSQLRPQRALGRRLLLSGREYLLVSQTSQIAAGCSPHFHRKKDPGHRSLHGHRGRPKGLL